MLVAGRDLDTRRRAPQRAPAPRGTTTGARPRSRSDGGRGGRGARARQDRRRRAPAPGGGTVPAQVRRRWRSTGSVSSVVPPSAHDHGGVPEPRDAQPRRRERAPPAAGRPRHGPTVPGRGGRRASSGARPAPGPGLAFGAWATRTSVPPTPSASRSPTRCAARRRRTAGVRRARGAPHGGLRRPHAGRARAADRGPAGPARRPGERPAARPARLLDAGLPERLGAWLIPNLICVGIWLASGAHGSFWPVWVLPFTTVALVRRSWGARGPGPGTAGVTATTATAHRPGRPHLPGRPRRLRSPRLDKIHTSLDARC